MKTFAMLILIVLFTAGVVMAAPMQAKDPAEEMAPNEWGKLRSWMAQNDWSQAMITECLGGSPGGRKTSEIIDTMRACIAELPQAPNP